MEKVIRSIFDGFDVEKIGNKYIVSTENTDSFSKCIDMKIEDGILYVNELKKCGISGTDSLKRIESLAINLGISQIHLVDGSTINTCDQSIDLATLKILTNGMSWYNSLGYFSNQFTEEYAHNNEIIKTPCKEFFRKVYENSLINFNKSVERYKKNNFTNIELYESNGLRRIEEKNANVIYGFDTWFKKYENISVKIFFNDIIEIMRENCYSEKLVWLNQVLNYILISDIIKYDNNLIKNIEKKGGKKRKKTIKNKIHKKTKVKK